MGTNVDVKPENLFEFAILGKLYAEYVFHVNNPKVGLLKHWRGKRKGMWPPNQLISYWSRPKHLNLLAMWKAETFSGIKPDVIVCDGFTGNVALKQAESFYRIMTKRGIKDDYLERFNYENYGGTPVLGTKSPVMVGHGISNAKAFKNMLLHSREMAHAELPAKIERSVIKNIQNR
ncbi:MAG: hypothetical protein U5L09_07275 [Bacteroidales bacterium]|nr:hypothetical protein [Bacteroidales bacterium]